MSGIYHMNGVPTAYSTIAEEVQKGRDAKISHLLAQVTKNYCNNYYKYPKDIEFFIKNQNVYNSEKSFLTFFYQQISESFQMKAGAKMKLKG